MSSALSAPPVRPVRYRCELDARVEWEGQRHPARILDLSRTGAFIETQLDLQVGDRARVGLALPGGDPVFLDVVVVRLGKTLRDMRHPRVHNLTVRAIGVGVQFVEVPDEDATRLDGFLELLDER
ncbi:MAG: PilZ domain-containing protein [Myxococcaceae bacterium]